jgi:undecaprenyl-diphosphatase
MNHTIFFSLYGLAHQSIYFDSVAIFFAKYFPYLVIILAVIFLLFHHEIINSNNPFKAFSKKWREIVLVFFSGVTAWVIASILKIIIQAPRPYLVLENIVPLLQKTDFSFPSGHATFYMALAFALFFSHKKIGYLFMFFALLIGLARIIIGVHFPIDILGGYILGIITTYFIKFLYNKIKKRE